MGCTASSSRPTRLQPRVLRRRSQPEHVAGAAVRRASNSQSRSRFDEVDADDISPEFTSITPSAPRRGTTGNDVSLHHLDPEEEAECVSDAEPDSAHDRQVAALRPLLLNGHQSPPPPAAPSVRSVAEAQQQFHTGSINAEDYISVLISQKSRKHSRRSRGSNGSRAGSCGSSMCGSMFDNPLSMNAEDAVAEMSSSRHGSSAMRRSVGFVDDCASYTQPASPTAGTRPVSIIKQSTLRVDPDPVVPMIPAPNVVDLPSNGPSQ